MIILKGISHYARCAWGAQRLYRSAARWSSLFGAGVGEKISAGWSNRDEDGRLRSIFCMLARERTGKK